MSQIVIEAQQRTPGGKNVNRRLRKSGRIPAVIYGRGKAPLALSVDPISVGDILRSESGHNTIFSVRVDARDPVTVMVKDYQLDPTRGHLIHTDFLEIAMDKLLEVSVDIEVVGEAEGVKVDGGLLDVVTRAINVECLPSDIPDSVKVDVTGLKINDYIRVKNLPVDPRYKILTDAEVVLVTVAPPIKEEVVPVEAAPAEPTEPEVLKKGKAAEEPEEEEKGREKEREKEREKKE
jgi:large subunit ribosomal protein L25